MIRAKTKFMGNRNLQVVLNHVAKIEEKLGEVKILDIEQGGSRRFRWYELKAEAEDIADLDEFKERLAAVIGRGSFTAWEVLEGGEYDQG